MLINKNTKIIGERVILVPYRKEHVPKYHQWMKSEELQKLTASDPLTLQEEYEMQESWMRDTNKLTFIILDKAKYERTQDEVAAMVGDTNLFLLNTEDGEPSSLVAEAEIMIAEVDARGKHLGREGMLLMLNYGACRLGIRQFVVKIGMDNAISVNMFTAMGFIQTGSSEVFKEITMEKIVDEMFKSWLEDQTQGHSIQQNDGDEFSL